MNLAFIGLGRMGSAMARNLLRAGHSLTLFNRTRDKADALVPESQGASVRVTSSIEDAVCEAEAAFTMLADDEALEEVVSTGLRGFLPRDAIHISSGTISTKLARRLAQEHHERGQRFVSAPVFGRPEAAEAKRLLVIAGGEPDALDRCGPVFEAIGRQTFVAGSEPWQANAVKLCGNFMIGSMIETFGEANATLRKAGVAPHLFLEVMNALFASPLYATYGRMIADEAFTPAGFPLRLGLKDVRLILDTAVECESPMPIAGIVRDQFLSAMANGQCELDWSSVAQSAARHAGLRTSES